ncbi:beta-lactamase domain-containing protein [Paraphoma chrysanthemicola]|uniref:Beta-lactamase domain-containing protein n=1 Tax=Paraphoma chrysanthemicola TaxID=798071 RepID=A0A8K0VTK0_9PLEO|nr:beta-lactamase domain-containing protein [Paraphoma chrysanthemicola]
MSAEPFFDDRRDFDDTSRGFIASLDPGVIRNSKGDVVWNIDEFKFLEDECPSTAHPNLWRQGQLNSKQGLYEIVPGIYQVRAFDLSNVTFVEGKTGIVVIDPLVSCECAKAALDIYQEHRGHGRKITGMIYSHSHGDHYMGAQGCFDGEPDPSIPIIAPEGFMEAILSENMIAGPSMRKRGAYMYGSTLKRGPKGHIGTGLGMASSRGTTSLILPTHLIQKTGEEMVVDGVRIVFQMVPGTEAPAEVNFHFPDFNALCVPETATNCMHNIITLRGAQVRDAKAWSQYLDESILLFGYKSDVVFGSHNWPTWGKKELITRLSEQRDMYGYMHDQTVRMMNNGLTGIEIAEKIQFPPAISRAWHCRGFYGSLSHNVKGIYQKYMTWFDGNPSHLWQYPPKEEGERYVACFGGLDGLLDKAETFIKRDDSRFAATLLGHAIAVSPDHERTKDLLATTYENLGYGAENATWRNFYLVAAQELRLGIKPPLLGGGGTALGPKLPTADLFQILGVQLDGDKAANANFSMDFDFSNERKTWRVIISNGVLVYRRPEHLDPQVQGRADLELRMTKLEFLKGLRGEEVTFESKNGDTQCWERFLSYIAVGTAAKRGPSQL